jgi:glucose/arabinose dehydrogenase
MIGLSGESMRLSRTLLALSLLAAAACGGSDDSPPSSPPPAGSGDTVTGRERFGWTQPGSASDASGLQFATYVDGARSVLDGVACSGGSSGTLECSAPLPPMTAGRHTLELAAFYQSGATIIEGPRSPPLQLQVASVTASNGSSSAASVPAPEGGPVTASDGTVLNAEILGTDLVDPADVAVDPSGRTFVAERAGTIRIFDQDGTTSTSDSAGRLPPSRNGDAAALSIALAPDFAESHFVYVLKVEPGAGESRALLVRYRESDGRFGQAAVIATAPFAAVDPAGVIRFGPDGALYVGLGSRSIDAETLAASPDGGRILRLLPDGRTPRDNPRASPVYSSGHRDPSGFVWHRTGSFLEVESGIDADEVNTVRAGGDYGWPAINRRARPSGTSSPTVLLPAGTIPSGLTSVDDRRSPLDGDLIVSSIGSSDLLRIAMTPDGKPTPAEPGRLLQGRFGAIGQVTAGPGGAVVFITRNREAWGVGHDVLVRLTIP